MSIHLYICMQNLIVLIPLSGALRILKFSLIWNPGNHYDLMSSTLQSYPVLFGKNIFFFLDNLYKIIVNIQNLRIGTETYICFFFFFCFFLFVCFVFLLAISFVKSYICIRVSILTEYFKRLKSSSYLYQLIIDGKTWLTRLFIKLSDSQKKKKKKKKKMVRLSVCLCMPNSLILSPKNHKMFYFSYLDPWKPIFVWGVLIT